MQRSAHKTEMLTWIIDQTVNVFGCSAFCGHVDDTEQPSSVPFHQMGSRFIKNVWSELELESSTFESSVGTSMDSSDDESGESRQGSYISCQEPQETGSNIPVLRQLPSFGSNLASNSLESEIYRSSTGLHSYATRQSSMDSTTQRKFSIPPLFGSSDDEHLEVRNVKEVPVSPMNTTDSFIFLRQ